MLLPTMNHQEIRSQIQHEYEKLNATTIERLFTEYDRERKKLKIKKDNPYMKEYSIKTRGKNNWIIFIHKGPALEKYKSGDYVNSLAVVYYYSENGLRVLYTQENLLVGFNAHFFKRYNERLKLNLSNPLDIVKAYFRTEFYGQNKIIKKGNNTHIIGFRSHGLQFGLVKYNNSYVEWKTFVNKELAFRSQKKMEREVVGDLKDSIGAITMFENTGIFTQADEEKLLHMQGIYLSLTSKQLTA